METKENHQTFIKNLLHKQNEMINKELTGYFSTLGNKKHNQNKYTYTDTYRKLSIYEHKISSLEAQVEMLKKQDIILHGELQLVQTYNKEIL